MEIMTFDKGKWEITKVDIFKSHNLNEVNFSEKLNQLSCDELEDFEERAGIMEFDGGLSKDEAELETWKIIIRKRILN